MIPTCLAPISLQQKEPVLPAHRDDAQRALDVVGIDRYVRVTQIDAQLRLMVIGIHQGLGQRRAVDKIQPLALLITPAEGNRSFQDVLPLSSIDR